MMKALKNITLTLFISSALACGGMAQTGINQLDPQKDRRKEPERPVEKRKNDDRGDRGDRGGRGDDKRDDGGKRGKRP
jgi:hypothetical protein